uniref:DUF4203 domain-containing protein n=1 Tax=Moniliophthora roreri TaxID=221103 RepID=A0A0W0G251_MONRR
MPTNLLTLLPTPSYTLAYALPLLFLSLLITFAGSFLTLDRTRQFRPSATAEFTKKNKLNFYLEGGVGGLILGYSFGLHLATFLTLVISNLTPSPAPSKAAFVPIWLLSCLPTTFLGARYRHFALFSAAVVGGIGFTLFLAIILHPALLTRQIFAAIIIPILLLFVLLPIPKTQRGALRFSAASAGTFGLTLAIALLCRIPSWANMYERLWISDGEGWQTAQERGLSAGYALFLIFGVVCDWLLNRMFGECPDEKWDSYLSQYTSNLPDRAGHFEPFKSVWQRLRSSNATSAGGANEFNAIPDDEVDLEYGKPDPFLHYSPAKLSKQQEGKRNQLPRYDELSIPSTRGQLKKGRSSASKRFQSKSGAGRRNREAVKFRSAEEGISSDSDSDSGSNELLKRPWLRQSFSNASTNTLVGAVDYDKEIKALRKKKMRGMGEGEVPDYSDYESDVGEGGGKGGRRPSLAQSASSSTGRRDSDTTKVGSGSLPGSALDKETSQPQQMPIPVPATPSLIRALDRVALAQREAYGTSIPSGLPRLAEESHPPSPSPFSSPSRTPAPQNPEPTSPDQEELDGRADKWDAFWKEVVL